MRTEPRIVRIARMLHGGVLWAYPSGLEPEYRQAIAADAARMLDEAHARDGWAGVARLCPGLFADILGGLVSAHARTVANVVARRPSAALRLLSGRSRACRGAGTIHSMALDFRHAVRAARAGGATTALTIGLLAVAVAAQAVVLAALDGVLLRPLPYAAPDRLVTLYELSTIGPATRQGVAPGNFLSWKAESSSFAALAASTTATMTAAAPTGPTAVRVTRVTADFFRVFAREPAAGRVLRPDDFDGAVWHATSGYVGTIDAAVISEGLAVRQFGTPDAAIGRAIRIEGRSWRIVGVMDRAFHEAAGTGDLWLPWDLHASYIRSGLPRPAADVPVPHRPRPPRGGRDCGLGRTGAHNHRVAAGGGVSG